MSPQAAPASQSAHAPLIKTFWSNVLGPAWVVSLAVYAFVAIVRFVAFFSPFALQEIFFLQTLAMWALPFIVLTQSGRREIELAGHSLTLKAAVLSALAGAACALAFFEIGMVLYGDSPNNWCISIRNYLHFDEMRGLLSPLELFGLYALPAIFLNPIGEEILFRGFIQQAFARRFNSTTGTVVSSILFGALYLCLHGFWIDAAGLHIRAVPAALTITLMAIAGVVFSLCRVRTKSLWAAMAAHAGFNLMMLGAAIHQFVR